MQTRISASRRTGGFTLVELLVVIAIVSILAAFLLPAFHRAKIRASGISCLGQMRQLGIGLQMYADENGDQFPRSQHSSMAYGVATWGRALLPYLSVSIAANVTPTDQKIFRCSQDKRSSGWSYGLNVYFELDPALDEYPGAPATWRKTTSLRNPSGTILLGEVNGSVDHIMAHFWEDGGLPEVMTNRHGLKSNYNFADGSAKTLAFDRTYTPPRVNLWHPGGR
ncbi:MAG: type II secretion system protein [Limisphaerales bacterium]